MTEHPLSNESEEFLSWLAVERGRAPHTLAAYRRDLWSYEQALATRGCTPLDAPRDALESHLAHLRATKAPASSARALSVLRGLHRFLLDEGMVSRDPSVDLEAGRLPARIPKALSETEVGLILDDASGTTALARRDLALIEFLYGTGARISEAVGLDLVDLSGGEGLVRLYGKGSKERLVPLGRCANVALADWLGPAGRQKLEPTQWRRRNDAEAVFLNQRGGRLSRQGAYAIIRKHAEAVGLGQKVSPHVLRHSCASHMLAHGADIRVVQELLGHVSIATTQLYTKVSAEHLRLAYESAHPRAHVEEPVSSS
jgi:integrase/recombinase XerD